MRGGVGEALGPIRAAANIFQRNAGPVLVVGTHSIHVRRFVSGLCAAGQSVVLATDSSEPLVEHALLLEQVTVGFPVHRLSTAGKIRRCIDQWRPRVVHAHQANSVAWHAVRAARSTSVPVVLTLWGSDVLSLPHRSPLHRWMVRVALLGASAWTADARILLEAAKRLAGSCETIVGEWIPMGIDTPPTLAPMARERRMLSCRLHKPLYRIDSILRAFARLPVSHVAWVLEIAAGGDETARLRRLTIELGIGDRVEFTGMLGSEDLARSYRRSAIFVSVPVSDGTSVSLLEAMAAGCLPVLSDLPANREWVTDGCNGLLVTDPANLDTALQSAVKWWESGNWDLEGRAVNEQLVMEHALFGRNIQQFIALYERLQVRHP